MTKPSSEFLKDPPAIYAWIAKHCNILGSYTLDAEHRVVVSGRVQFKTLASTDAPMTHFAVEFAAVSSGFSCQGCDHLESLAGSPKTVNDFDCSFCPKLKTLEGCPTEISGNFTCRSCDGLTTLQGSPTTVGGDYECCQCHNLISLNGSPERIPGNFDCHSCSTLASLEGGPVWVGGDYCCIFNPSLLSLKWAPLHIGFLFQCSNCENLTSLDGLPSYIGQSLNIYKNGITVLDRPITCEKVRFLVLQKPTAAVCKSLLMAKTELQTDQATDWVVLVNDYYKTGDLLTAIARFETCFGESFHAIISAVPDLEVGSFSLDN